MGAKSGRCLGLVMYEKGDLKAMCRFLTSREMYIYFKDCSIAKSHKLCGVVGRRCLSLGFVGIWGNPAVGLFRKNRKVPNGHRRTFEFRIH